MLSSYFFADATLLMKTSRPTGSNGEREELERWTSPGPLSATLASKPLKILISQTTFSAAESFAFAMKNLGRAELVGATSGGGGYSNDFFALPHGMGASISVGRSYDPRTGLDWQGIGVEPDVAVPQDHALDTALDRLTKESGKFEALQGEEVAIYQQLQSYADAWYGAAPARMAAVLSDDFSGASRDPASGARKVFTRDALVKRTADGMGVKKNPLHTTRLIRDIEIDGDEATVTLFLSDSVHRILLVQRRGAWLIRRDESKGALQG